MGWKNKPIRIGFPSSSWYPSTNKIFEKYYICCDFTKKLFKIFSKVLCDIIPACFRRF